MKAYIFTFALIVSLPLIIKADPPKKILLNYTAETHTIKIEAVHPVKNVQKHYIDLVSIYVNGKEVKTVKPVSQTSKESEILEVVVPQIVAGCEVTVKAQCNEFGTKKETQKF